MTRPAELERQDRLARPGRGASAGFEQRAAAVRAAGQRWTVRRFFVAWRAVWRAASWWERLTWPWRHEVMGVASRDFGPTPAARAYPTETEIRPATAEFGTWQPSSSTAAQPRKGSHMAQRPNYAVAANRITAREYAAAVREGMRTGGASKTEVRRAASKAYRSAVRGGARRR